MPTISRTELVIENRQRTDLDPIHIRELKESILARGLLHAPVVRYSDAGGYILVAGGCRLQAIDEIWLDNGTLIFDTRAHLPGELPVVIADLEHASEWMSAEFEENAMRRELPWQDRVRAIAAIHAQRISENPEQTFQDTASEIREQGKIENAPSSQNALASAVKEATVVAQFLDKYKIKNARNPHEAFALIMQDEQKKYEAMLVQKRLAIAPSLTDIEVRHGDMSTILPSLDNDRFDLILTDPPYGIGADESGFRSRGVQHHGYEDSPEHSRQLLQIIISEGFRVCKARANLFIFTDWQHFDWLHSRSAAAGWVPWRTPIIWQKSKSEGLAPWGRSGFRRTYEMVFFATKGQRGLIHSPCDILEARRVSKSDRRHGAEKPVDLLRQLIECSTLLGDSVLDPCCGVGSTLQAMRQLKRKGLGIELDIDYYNVALTRAHTDDEEEDEQTDQQLSEL